MVSSRAAADTSKQNNETPGGGQPGRPDRVTLFLSGDVMTGRGVDQVLPRPCEPELFERYVTSAADYVRIAEEANGAIPRPVDFPYVWGDALAELEARRPDARLINLETAVTTSGDAAPKGINYRMNPANIEVLTAARIDGCALANNHVLDWGERGLRETLETLARAKVKCAGAGRNLAEAASPAILPIPAGRVILFAFGSPTSGVQESWGATDTRPGVNYLPRLDRKAVGRIARQIASVKKPGDIAVASIHWGGNWGYAIPDDQRAFAHGLIDESDVDVVWGHSSHHPKAVEVHSGKLILYGCGDFLNDYEGIRGYETFRDDLALMYLATLRVSDGALDKLAMTPFRIRNFRLNRAARADAEWLRDLLNREGGKFGTGVALDADNTLALRWDARACGGASAKKRI